MRLTIDIDITNNKALALLNYIRTLDFISIIEKDNNKEYALTDEQTDMVKKRKHKHLMGESKSFSWNDIKMELKE
jgi:hypothetical protein